MTGSPPVRAPRRQYPGWHMVWALSATETVSYGVLFYTFAAVLLPMQQDLGYSRAELTGAFSMSLLITGFLAVPLGAWLDRHGARLLMTAGSLLGGASVALWAMADNVPTLYLAFAGIGVAGAATQYEPAFATVNAYFDRDRRTALLTLTVVAGFASTIFVPLATTLTESLGWRSALLVLAAVQAATAVPHALLLRRRPTDHGWLRDGVRAPTAAPDTAPPLPPTPAPPVWTAVRYPPVLLLTAASLFGTAAIAVIGVHLVTYLREDGYTPTVAAWATGGLGALQVLGRVVLTASARRVRLADVTAWITGGQVLAVAALLLVPGAVGLVVFVVLFGLGFGVLHLARADLLAGYAPHRLYARISGLQALVVITVEALTPTAASLARAATGDYTAVLLGVGVCALAAALFFAAADRVHRRGSAVESGSE